ncbi:MAG: oxygen-independent coproporphyrinogen III oxidase [Bacteroidales bacterium]|nr:oxygen-independent coproporphyrinogen III oxidase [Bacteroidales bacterium]
MLIQRDLLEKYNKAVPRYTSYPPANFFSDKDAGKGVTELLQASNNDRPENISLYIHIPFCPQLCWYCGCNTTITVNKNWMADYLEALKKEIAMVAAKLSKERKVTQVHWGGGTPNYLKASQIQEIMKLLNDNFVFDKEPEIAIECNPAYLTYNYVDELLEAGFNRFSIGIQDFKEEVLDAVKRGRPNIPIRELTDYIRKNRNAAVNLDFMYGLPYQDEASYRQTIQQALAIQPDRLVTFSYAHVPWFKKAQKSLEKHGLPSADEKLRLFENAFQIMTENGYIPIGLDHFAKADDELSIALKNNRLHRNFQGYATRETTGQVYAFGTSAISQLDSAYFQNTKEVNTYISRLKEGQWPAEKIYEVNFREKVLREIINEIMCNRRLVWKEVADRMDASVDTVKSFSAVKEEELEGFFADGLIEYSEKGISVTDKGRFFIRNIAAAFDPLVKETDKKFSKSI